VDTDRLQTALEIVRQAQARFAMLAEPPPAAVEPESLRAVAERLYLERRRRDEFFPAGLFGEPAWDLLLSLFIAHDEGRSLTLSEAFTAAKVQPEDGPDLIERLLDAGLISREQGCFDRRRGAIVLTDEAVHRLAEYLTDLL